MIGGTPWAQRESVHASLRVYILFRSSACFFFIIAIFRMDVYRSRSYNFISIVVHPSQHACQYKPVTYKHFISFLFLHFFFSLYLSHLHHYCKFISHVLVEILSRTNFIRFQLMDENVNRACISCVLKKMISSELRYCESLNNNPI